MAKPLAMTASIEQPFSGMLTGDQIVGLRKWAQIKTQAELALRAGLGARTIARAEAAGGGMYAPISCGDMTKIMAVFQAAGARFSLQDSGKVTDGFSIHTPPKPLPLPPLPARKPKEGDQ